MAEALRALSSLLETTVPVSLGLIMLTVTLAGGLILFQLLLWRGRFRTSAASFQIPFGLGSITYQATDQDQTLAWKLYVHLGTRKATVPFDRETDVVVEVYDSLYELFQVARDLLSALPPNGASHGQTTADLVLRVLNDGLRPHLTRWQATFRRWWLAALDETDNRARRPQEIQRDFPDYDALVAELELTQAELLKLAEELLAVARPQRVQLRRKLWAWIHRPAPLKTRAEAPVPTSPPESLVPAETCENPTPAETRP